MSIVRKIRKRFTRNPATPDDISRIFHEALRRSPAPAEIAHWHKKYLTPAAIKRRLAKVAVVGEPGAAQHLHTEHLSKLSDEAFVEYVCLTIAGRFPSSPELQTTAEHLRSGAVDRIGLLLNHFIQAAREETARRSPEQSAWKKLKNLGDSPSFSIMGTPLMMFTRDWRRRARAGSVPERPTTHARFPLRPRQSEIDVSVLCSLWRGGEFIERYMENITSQTIFRDRCELIVIDAASPEGEGEVIERYKARFGDRIVYHRMPYRTGIYAAWNYGVGLARGRYLTNANLDDLRRVDSLERQASALDALSFVDVVYDDHLYFCDPQADYDLIERVGVASELPLVTRNNMFVMNPPHNGPMWRANLHEKVGFFDESYRSAGDYDFWIRALIDGATFYKLNEPTVGYYFHPEGLSTSSTTGAGILEPRLVLRRHGARLIPEAAREAPEAFLRRLGLSAWPVENGMQVSRYRAVQIRMRVLARQHASAWSGQ